MCDSTKEKREEKKNNWRETRFSPSSVYVLVKWNRISLLIFFFATTTSKCRRWTQEENTHSNVLQLPTKLNDAYIRIYHHAFSSNCIFVVAAAVLFHLLLHWKSSQSMIAFTFIKFKQRMDFFSFLFLFIPRVFVRSFIVFSVWMNEEKKINVILLFALPPQ